jgi:hypothetical protein
MGLLLFYAVLGGIMVWCAFTDSRGVIIFLC